jgi:polynucleotide 5'-hydroxyl-kinase GRC3/NOL9
VHERARKGEDAGAEALVGLLAGELLCLHGACVLAVRAGAVVVNDVVLRASHDHTHTSRLVVAPYTGPAAVVCAVPAVDTAAAAAVAVAVRSLGTAFAGGGVAAVVSVLRCDARLPGLTLLRVPRDLAGARGGDLLGVDGVRIAVPGTLCHTIPPQWPCFVEEVVAFVRPGDPTAAPCVPIIAVCGGKSTGKSSLCRHLVGVLMARCGFASVAWLDCDAGQPEFTPPGLVSLTVLTEPVLGPPFLNVAPSSSRIKPVLSFYLGDVTHQPLPGFYLRCVELLVAEAVRISAATQMPMPLIINTSGWISGAGYDTLVEILRVAAPTHVV